MPIMTCPQCAGEIEYVVERVDSGDGPWAQSGWVSAVLWELCAESGAPDSDGNCCRTVCGCVWTVPQMDELENRVRALDGRRC